MEERTIGLVAAMPEEIKPLLRLVRPYRKSSSEGFALYTFDCSGTPCRLIVSGMGGNRAKRAVEALCRSMRPALIISFGFGGAVKPGMEVGDLAVASSSRLYRDGCANADNILALPIPVGIRNTLENVCAGHGRAVHIGNFLTSDKILRKKEVVGTLPPDIRNPVLDMETWAIAQAAAQAEIPLLALRAISDAADEELEFSLDQFVDREMNIRIWNVLTTIARKPRIIPQLMRLARNSRSAGKSLALTVHALLKSDALRQVCRGNHTHIFFPVAGDCG